MIYKAQIWVKTTNLFFTHFGILMTSQCHRITCETLPGSPFDFFSKAARNEKPGEGKARGKQGRGEREGEGGLNFN